MNSLLWYKLCCRGPQYLLHQSTPLFEVSPSFTKSTWSRVRPCPAWKLYAATQDTPIKLRVFACLTAIGIGWGAVGKGSRWFRWLRPDGQYFAIGHTSAFAVTSNDIFACSDTDWYGNWNAHVESHDTLGNVVTRGLRVLYARHPVGISL
jgi:hypothetical protein